MSKRGLIFKSIAGKKPRTNVFDLSHEKKLSMNMANLVPIYLQECIPSDKFRGNTELFIRFAPMVAPVMHRINAYVHYFFVPNRLVWDGWQDFITGGVDGTNNKTVPMLTIETLSSNQFQVGSLGDYFGINPPPETVNSNRYVSALPFRAYQLIYNEFYRDQTLQPEVPLTKNDTVDSNEQYAITLLRKRCWEKDRYTSALPWTQRGADVELPTNITYQPDVVDIEGTTTVGSAMTIGQIGSDKVLGTADGKVQVENIESLGTTINDLRTSIRLQEWLEKNARAGARYVEQIMAHFGSRVPDYRLQRPELIGSGKQSIIISEVLASFQNDTVAQGTMSGHGISAGSNAGFNYTCQEHGYIIGILSILPRTGYFQGIPRFLTKEQRFDFAFPEFANLGEEPVYTNEIYDDYSSISRNTLFGYQSRYSDYKYNQDTIHGEFRTNLEFWHLARKFATVPTLNNQFVQANVDEDRIFAIQDEATQKLWVQLYNNVRAIRPLPVYGTPIL